MIDTYSDYIARYITPSGLNGNKMPGEHHFVAVYLLRKLYKLNGVVPDYVNPDGTKGLIGDVVYFKDGSHRCGIEVKLGTIRLTRNEYNKWIVGDDGSCWSNVFLGVCSAGLILLSWPKFRALYVTSVSTGIPAWSPSAIERGYGPFKSMNMLFGATNQSACFPISVDARVAKKREAQFLDALNREIHY